jgi:hypothetical protein
MTDYPVRVDLEHPLEVPRWAPFVQWFLAIPHFVVLWVLGMVAGVCAFIGFFAVLFTGRVPAGLFDVQVLYWRYQWRTYSYVLGLRGGYPPFDFQTTGAMPDPAVLEAVRPERLSRLLILVKWLLAFPHYVVLFFLVVAAYFAHLVGSLAVLFTGRWPEPIRHLLVGVARWSYRVYGYITFVTDEYPPFSLD